jgi:glycosyltransferase involved in cell wall biosynthesis
LARVLLVHQPVDGGVGRHVADLARGLDGAGHDVILCGPERPVGAPDCCGHVRLPMRRSLSPRADLRACRRLNATIAATTPDLVHAHSSKAGAVARLVQLAHPGLPVVYTPHGYAFAGYFEREGERTVYRAIERALSALGGRILCVCEAEARLARRVARRRQIRVVHNGVAQPAEQPVIDPAMARLARRGPVIGTLTQLRRGKGLETLLDALPRVQAVHPDAQLAIWGDGTELEPLRRRAVRLQIDASVHFLGPTTDPLSIIAGTQVFAMPSLAESFPYVMLEAMSIGRPIVSTDVGGVGEAITSGEHGLLVAPGDAEALGDAVVTLLDDPAVAARLGAAARRRVRSDFTLGRMLRATLEVYAELSPRFADSVAETGSGPGEPADG